MVTVRVLLLFSLSPFNLLGGIKVNHAASVTVRAPTFALTHLTSARTAGVRCAMKCLVRPFTKGGHFFWIYVYPPFIPPLSKGGQVSGEPFPKGDKDMGCKGAKCESA